jgi:hypothetical protein
MKIAVLLVTLCLMPLLVLAQQVPPQGWRFPTESDYTYDWQEFRATTLVPFHVQADFNGDSLLDDGWVLLSTHDKAWGFFVFLAQKDAPPKVIALDKDPGTNKPQNMGIEVVPPGDYKTACGKGYFDCKPDEPEVLHLARPAINYFLYESANSFFWWDIQSGSFKRTWMSD